MLRICVCIVCTDNFNSTSNFNFILLPMQIHKILVLFLKLFPIMLDLVALFLIAV